MRSKLFSLLLALSLIFAFSSPVFADQNTNIPQVFGVYIVTNNGFGQGTAFLLQVDKQEVLVSPYHLWV